MPVKSEQIHKLNRIPIKSKLTPVHAIWLLNQLLQNWSRTGWQPQATCAARDSPSTLLSKKTAWPAFLQPASMSQPSLHGSVIINTCKCRLSNHMACSAIRSHPNNLKFTYPAVLTFSSKCKHKI